MPFLPREKKFFDLYEALAEKIIQAVNYLEELKKDYSELPRIAEDLNKLEDEADTLCHEIISQLHYDHTRVTEEKGDIRFFVHNMDNIIDAIEKAVNRLFIYRIPSLPSVFSEFLPLLKEAVEQIKVAVGCLRNVSKNDQVLAASCVRINDLENEADAVDRKWLAKVMDGEYPNVKDFKKVIAVKEIIEQLEYAMDQCEDVANILETFRLKGTV